jgi:membrane-associated protein
VGQLRGHLLLALAVTIGSALPFVPTGEMVSGAAAVAAHSEFNVILVFLITWVCSVIGDTLMLVEARLGARKLRPWIARRKFSGKVERAQEAVTRNAFNAVVTGRLIPGGRTPVIIALGLSRFPVRRFLVADTVACALWAAVYSTLGSLGARIANHPVWGLVIAIAFATVLGLLVGKLHSTVAERRAAVHQSS